MAAAQGRHVKRSEATVKGRTSETHTHTERERESRTHGRAASCLQPGSMGRGYWQYSVGIQPFTITANTQTFRYAAAPHAFCILAGPRTLKMDGMQPAQPISSHTWSGTREVFKTYSYGYSAAIPAIPAIQRLCQLTSPAPVRVWIRPGEITNGVINPGCAALPSQSAHSKPQTSRGSQKLNDKALRPITCPDLSLHDSPLRSCRIQSNGSQMVDPGTARPVTKAGLPASSALWQLGCAALCCASLPLCGCRCVCVCKLWCLSVINGGGGILATSPLSTLRKRGRQYSFTTSYCAPRTAPHGSSPPIPA
ncbi:hypothetical protein F5883DRAFT_191593 [Diaporthe sp. PMI_573]|nr:hypothetical protein F5883DRAFT_191593 [Diaporthaceae sp. PMI_573]